MDNVADKWRGGQPRRTRGVKGLSHLHHKAKIKFVKNAGGPDRIGRPPHCCGDCLGGVPRGCNTLPQGR